MITRSGFVHGTVNIGKCEELHLIYRYLLYRVHVGFPPEPATREVLIPRTTKRSALYHGVKENKKKKEN